AVVVAEKAAVALEAHWTEKMAALEAAMPASSSRVGIFWDMDSCGLPRGVPTEAVVDNIIRYLRTRGINQTISAFVVCIYDKHLFLPESVMEVLSRRGIEVVRGDIVNFVPKFVKWTKPRRHSIVLVISKDRYLTTDLFEMQRLRHTVLIAQLVYGQLKEWPELATYP
ncbi:hypothetical protein KI387_041074, partial [Taxus chinensis]